MCPKNGGQYKENVTSLIEILWVEYSWGIRGVFGEYSRGIHMYRVCVGYVSGMYRECIDTSEGRKRHQDCATAGE